VLVAGPPNVPEDHVGLGLTSGEHRGEPVGGFADHFDGHRLRLIESRRGRARRTVASAVWR